MLSVAINQSGAGTVLAIGAVSAPAFIRVHGYNLSAGATGGTVAFQSSKTATALDYVNSTGTPYGGLVSPEYVEGKWDVPAGEGLNVVVSGGAIAGSIQYSIKGQGTGQQGI